MIRPGRPASRPVLPHGEVQLHLLDLDGPVKIPGTATPGTGGTDPDSTNLLDSAERARAARFLNPEARRRYVRSRTGLRLLLGGYLGLPPARVPITLSGAGKPQVVRPGHLARIGFSVSYAGQYGLLAFVRGAQVGVDFEAVQARPGLSEVAARFFAPQEQAALQRLHPDEALLAFHRVWTRREAVLKALGTGLTAPPDEVRVSTDAVPERWLLEARSPGLPVPSWLTRDLHVDPGYCAALAVPGGAGFRVRLLLPAS